MKLPSVLSACSPKVMFRWFQHIITARCNRPIRCVVYMHKVVTSHHQQNCLLCLLLLELKLQLQL
jgi:hypothetical protein